MKTASIILTMWLSLASLPAFALTPDPYVHWVVDQITPDSYRTIMNPSLGTLLYNRTGDSRMADKVTSGQTQAKLSARANIKKLLCSYLSGPTDCVYLTGLFDLNKITGMCDIIGIKRGTDEARAGIYIMTCHYDSMDRNQVCAPGADDNSSGVTAVLEAARVLGQTTTKASIVFVVADCEEIGNKGPDGRHLPYGDDYFIANFFTTAPSNPQQIDPERVRAVIGVDMISYNSPDESDSVYLYDAGQGFDKFMAELRGEMRRWSGFPAENIYLAGSNNKSDHYPYFKRKAIPSAMVIEKGYLKNPNYHSANDSVSIPGYIDYDYAAKITRGVVGYVANRADITSINNGLSRIDIPMQLNPLVISYN